MKASVGRIVHYVPDPADGVMALERGPGMKQMKAFYIDCGDVDQYNLVYGARRLHRLLERQGVSHVYEEFADDHSSVDYRMDVSLPILAKALAA